jgi:hypothetical protein
VHPPPLPYPFASHPLPSALPHITRRPAAVAPPLADDSPAACDHHLPPPLAFVSPPWSSTWLHARRRRAPQRPWRRLGRSSPAGHGGNRRRARRPAPSPVLLIFSLSPPHRSSPYAPTPTASSPPFFPICSHAGLARAPSPPRRPHPGAALAKGRAKRGKLPFCSFALPKLLQRACLPAASPVKLFWSTLWHSFAQNIFLSCWRSCAKQTLTPTHFNTYAGPTSHCTLQSPMY